MRSHGGWTPRGWRAGLPLRVERITTGHSNEVFRVERGDHRWALRRPPRTPLSPTAHDMAREFRLISAFRDPRGWPDHAPVPVPEPVALCTDTDVIGAPFYLMEHLDGVVVRERVPAPLVRHGDGRRRLRVRDDGRARRHPRVRVGSAAASVTTAVPTATSSARCRVGSVSSSGTAPVTSPRSTKPGAGCRRTRRP